jgi:hypothetical protein
MLVVWIGFIWLRIKKKNRCRALVNTVTFGLSKMLIISQMAQQSIVVSQGLVSLQFLLINFVHMRPTYDRWGDLSPRFDA